ncbi:MAG: hypothetical protein R6X09_01570 [Bacteroidales bacterium]
MTGTTSPFRLLVVSFLLVSTLYVGSVKGQSPDTIQQQGVKFTGLTKTLANLLKTRQPENIVVGAYEICLEDLIDDDIAAVFDCDSVMSRYLDEAGDGATYRMLSYEMSRTIESRFVYDDGYLYVNIFSDTTAEGMYFNISISRGKPVTIPVVLHASDTSFATSFDTTLTAVFNADIDLFVNAALAIADSQSRATQVRINTFTFEVFSGSEEEFPHNDCFESESREDFSAVIQNAPKEIPVEIEGTSYKAAMRCFSLYAKTYWHLSPADATDFVVEEGVSHTLTFEQIEKGDFLWDESYVSLLKADLVMIPVDEAWGSIADSENRTDFQYVVDDLFDKTGVENISLGGDFWIREGVTARSGKYVFKPGN